MPRTPQNRILPFNLIPIPCWKQNVRSLVLAGDWGYIRDSVVHGRAKGHCEACGSSVSLECHEVWSFDWKTRLQKLEGLRCLCEACHKVTHLDALAIAQGVGVVAAHAQLLARYATVNGITLAEAEQDHVDAFRDRRDRDAYQRWFMDVSLIEKAYGLHVEVPSWLTPRPRSVHGRRRTAGGRSR